jgi:hypothetical protein
MKINPVGAELFHAVRQTDEFNSTFPQYCENSYEVSFVLKHDV